MMAKSFFWGLSFVFLTISTVSPHQEYFYKTSTNDETFLDTDIITLPNVRIKRSAESLINTNTTVQQKHSSFQAVNDRINGTTKQTKQEINPSNTSLFTNDSDKVLGKNLTSVTHEPPVQGSTVNISYIGTPTPLALPGDLDFPSAITNETLKNHSITNSRNDSHIYYNSTTINDLKVFNDYWVDLVNHPDANVHEMLSDSHRRAATINLKFQFPFYGHLLNSTTIATGGFLYLGEYIHSWLAATQYIAPLMANFDLSSSNYSNIYYLENDTALTVTWHNATLQDKPKVGGFTFQTTLHSNGNIVFAYKNIPTKIKEIDSTNHPVKIGLSDAYVLDKTIFFVRRKTIYEYHRVTFHEDEVTNGTVIILTALPTCLDKKNCSSCIKKDTNFQCFWCDNRCSSGVDRNRQDWHQKDCEKLKLSDEQMCTSGVTTVTPPTVDNSSVESSIKSESHTNSSSSSTSLIFIALCISLILMSLVWIFYAYLNPHTRSGQILIRYRPNQWGWRKGEARYTAATIHM
ncbi:plexin domain-containing protein 2 [Melanaphis sacchari]|uniref:Plexin domain-containing protein 2 n=1 Tax=Melanaphis sacchari TaxID=742174 RepID=A0A2H8TSR7_9HEMI|nr:plexin domain-containing protein 2 [Melanaphis sacchari]